MQDFTKVIKEMIGLFESLTDVEKQKIEAAKKNDVVAVEDSMKKEQAAVMKLKGLEQQRIKAAKNHGWEDLSFREILKREPDSRRELEPLFDALEDKIRVFQASLEDAASLIDINLHLVSTELDRRGTGIYDGSGRQPEPAAHLKSRKA